jgi:choline dehydrogenase-like flavoprotein
MMTVRGTTEDYNRWGRFFGNASDWSWEGLMPYFQKALNFAPPGVEVTESANITYDTEFWGNTSGVYAGWPSYQYPGTPVLFNAYKEVPGIEFPSDSGAGKTGVYWFPTFMDPNNVTRSYSKTGHYENLNRSNYHLITGSKVNRIVLNGTTATGVTFVEASTRSRSTNSTGGAKMVRANKEVILAAGAIHSPQILQLSGIGPKALLGQANITTVVDLPGVGQNFQDHPMLSVAISCKCSPLRSIVRCFRALTCLSIDRNFSVRPSAVDLVSNATFRAWAAEVWAANKTGPNSIAAGNAAAWLPFPVISSRYEEIAANLSVQDHAAQLAPETDSTVVAGYKAQMQSYAAALRSNRTAFYGSVIVPGRGSGNLIDLHPLSRGTVNIDVTDPEGKEPVVDYRALSNPLDTAVLVDLIRFARRYYFNNTVNAQFEPQETRPGDSVTSESDLAGYVASTLSPSEFHPVGTCAMMPRELGGVVDEKLKVYGVSQLRVVDGSMMPTLPGANTCQTVYAVAEKVSRLPDSECWVLICY